MPRRKAELLARVSALIEHNQDERFDVAEDTGLYAVDHELVQTVGGILRLSSELMADIQEIFDGEDAESEQPGDHADTDDSGLGPRSGALSPREIADLAFMSRSEMLALLELLESSAASNNVWKVLSYADTGLSRSERALIAIESAVREREGMEAKQRSWLNLEDALAIRREYALFRRGLLRLIDPAEEALLQELGQALERITALRHQPSYSLMRIDDRRQIRALQKRIGAALEDPRPEDEEQRRALWQDLLACSRLLMEVNNREELLDHDRHLVIAAYRELFESKSPRPEAIEELTPLIGRDAELDGILLAPEKPRLEDGRESVQRLAQELAPGLDDS